MSAQKLADEAGGESILVVSHWDAVSGSVARLRPWTISDHVVHTAFTVAWRERLPGVPGLLAVVSWRTHAAVVLPPCLSSPVRCLPLCSSKTYVVARPGAVAPAALLAAQHSV